MKFWFGVLLFFCLTIYVMQIILLLLAQVLWCVFIIILGYINKNIITILEERNLRTISLPLQIKMFVFL